MTAHQRGFIQLSLMGWLAVAASVAFLAMSASIYWYKSRYEAVSKEYATFQATVKAQGELAAKEAARINADNLKRKETADAQNTKLRADVAALAKRLRGTNPPESGLPSVPADAKRIDIQCFAADEFRRSYGTLVTDLRAIADQCAADAVDVESVRDWASGLR